MKTVGKKLSARIARLLTVSAMFVVLFFCNGSPALALKNTPDLSIPIPTIKFSALTVRDANGKRIMDVPWLGEYLSGIYKYATAIAVVLAAAVLVIGGFMYMTAGGSAERAKAAKQRIQDAVIGLALAFGAYILLVSVNPNLAIFNPVPVEIVKNEPWNELTFAGTPVLDAPPTDAAGAQSGTDIPAAACVRNFIKISSVSGVNADSFKGSWHDIHADLGPNMVELSKALTAHNAILNIGDTTRTQTGQFYRHAQIAASCGNRPAGAPAPSNSCKKTGHAPGRAIDLNIDGSNCKMKDGTYIANFMEEHGWVRLCMEAWHYEIRADHPSGLKDSVHGSHCFGGGADDLAKSCS